MPTIGRHALRIIAHRPAYSPADVRRWAAWIVPAVAAGMFCTIGTATQRIRSTENDVLLATGNIGANVFCRAWLAPPPG